MALTRTSAPAGRSGTSAAPYIRRPMGRGPAAPPGAPAPAPAAPPPPAGPTGLRSMGVPAAAPAAPVGAPGAYPGPQLKPAWQRLAELGIGGQGSAIANRARLAAIEAADAGRTDRMPYGASYGTPPMPEQEGESTPWGAAPGIEGAIQGLRAQLGIEAPTGTAGPAGALPPGLRQLGVPQLGAPPPWMQSGADLRKPLVAPEGAGAPPAVSPPVAPQLGGAAGNPLAALLRQRLAAGAAGL